MQSDLPHTLYKRRKDKSAGVDAPVRKDDPAFARQQEEYERKIARMLAQADGEEPYTLDDIFGK